MKDNVYLSVSSMDLQKMQFLLRETLAMMSRIYEEVVFSSGTDITAFHHAVETVRSQYDQVLDAMDKFNIIPQKGKSYFKE